MLVAERGRAALRVRGLSLWDVPLVRPAAVFTGAYVLATILSVNPRLSWTGAYLRQQGLYTWLAYPLFFLVTVLLVRERRQVERIVAGMLVAGAAVALHALLQLYGYDPLPWGGNFDRRAYGPAGNPIFLGAFLIVVIPITVAWLLPRGQERAAPAMGARGQMDRRPRLADPARGRVGRADAVGQPRAGGRPGGGLPGVRARSHCQSRVETIHDRPGQRGGRRRDLLRIASATLPAAAAR